MGACNWDQGLWTETQIKSQVSKLYIAMLHVATALSGLLMSVQGCISTQLHAALLLLIENLA